MVPGVEHLPSKLDRVALGDARVFVNLQIEVVDAGAVENVAPCVSDTPVGAASSQQQEGVDVVKAVDTSLLLRDVAVSGAIGPGRAGRGADAGARKIHAR